jgi:uncharacterized membrane protein
MVPLHAGKGRRSRLGWLGRSGVWMVGLAAGGLAVALYLSWVKLAGGQPACAVFGGCDIVNSSEYSEFMGIPVALFGAAGSVLLLGASATWWLRSSRPALLAAYLLGLAALPVIAYLTYLELFVIGAICIWCVAYALTIIGGWLVAGYTLMRSGTGTP